MVKYCEVRTLGWRSGPDPRLAALSLDGRALVLSRDVVRTAEAIRAHSAGDSAQYPEFCATLERLAAFLLPLLERTPPSIEGENTTPGIVVTAAPCAALQPRALPHSLSVGGFDQTS